MQNLKQSTKIILIVVSILAISGALGLFAAYRTEDIGNAIKADLLHESAEKAANQGHFILTPAADVFNKEGEESHKKTQQKTIKQREVVVRP